MPANNGLDWCPSTTFQGNTSTMRTVKSNPVQKMENVLQDFGTVSPHWKEIWLRRVQGNFETIDCPEVMTIFCIHQRDFVKKQGTPFTTSRTLFPTEAEGDTLQVRLNRWQFPSRGDTDTLNSISFFGRWWEGSMQNGDLIFIWRIIWTNELK